MRESSRENGKGQRRKKEQTTGHEKEGDCTVFERVVARVHSRLKYVRFFEYLSFPPSSL